LVSRPETSARPTCSIARERGVLECTRGGDPAAPLAGVSRRGFSAPARTRSAPSRDRARDRGTRMRIGPIEAIDGTPVVDLKAVLDGEG
jgi:L-fuculose-phosphate aldolase